MSVGTHTSYGVPVWFIHLISGGFAGCISKTIISPLDRVKILFQTKHPKYEVVNLGVVGTLRKIVQNEGPFKLWRGNTATLARIFPYASIQFMSYEKYKKVILGDAEGGSPHPLLHLICGSMAGATAVICTYPLDLMRARMASQVDENIYRNILHGLQEQLKKEGIKGWYRGSSATLQGILPYAGVNFSVYETLKYYAPKNEKGQLDTPWKLLCGGIAGPIGQTVSYPWDVVRRRQQTWGFATGTTEIKTWGVYRIMHQIIQTEGVIGLYRGLSINYYKATPTVAITFTSYELIKAFLTF
uniref:Uncharacterized protein n=1 Tax=Arcella intermedia TaxID=1963864 RepID=A0A6B2LC31_9EUKA|eukprot:TRINITY_DN25364_c0_g1_i1.p1 TRINITY_DN25364_c0_g1~~TRINITY_DN25364_c0_g1_i1.p1  ORF type:complete len:300 (+),score=61.08 TRINITY_DN25364_c0_g1_i1:38-937(+)